MSSRTPAWILAATIATAGLRGQCTTQPVPVDPLAGVRGTVYATTSWDPDGAGPLAPRIAVAGVLTIAGGVAANNIASFDPATGQWADLGAGTDQRVGRLAALGNGDLVAAGSFTTAGGAAATGIARWTGTAWTPLVGGAASPIQIRAMLTLPSGELLAAGTFALGGADAELVARWNGTAWVIEGTALPLPGFNVSLRALALLANGDIVAAGGFASINGVPAANLARWNGTTWSAIPNAPYLDAVVGMPNGDLIGQESLATTANFHRWNGTSWSSAAPSLTGVGNALAVLPNGTLVAAGRFRQPGAASNPDVFQLVGGGWSPLGTGIQALDASSESAQSLAVLPGGDLLVGGAFDIAGGVAASSIARWNGSAWSAVSPGLSGVEVSALLRLANGDVVVGGTFVSPGSVPTHGIARWNDAGWSPIGGPLPFPVVALTATSTGDLYAGGAQLLRFDGTTWTTILPGALVTGLATLPDDSVLVATGSLLRCVGTTVTTVATAIGPTGPFGPTAGRINTVRVTADGNALLGGGFASLVDGLGQTWVASNVARYDGSSFTPVGISAPSVSAMTELPNGDLVVGSYLPGALSRWNGTVWTPMTQAGGLEFAAVRALDVLPGGDLVAAGVLQFFGTTSFERLARWNGATWTPIDAGVDDLVTALAVRGNELMLGGRFLRPSALLSRIATTCPASSVAFGSGCTGPAGPLALVTDSLPFVGGTFRATATGFASPSLAVLVAGLTQLAVPANSVFPQAFAGCTIHNSADLLFGYELSQNGAVHAALAVPNTPALVGLALYLHYADVQVSPQLAIAGLATTNGLMLQIGAF